jgi:hypothetical protein
MDKKYQLISFLVLFILVSLYFYFINKNDLLAALFIGFFVGLIVSQILSFISQILHDHPEAKEFAEEMGFNYHDIFLGKGSMDGDYRDHPVRIRYYREISGADEEFNPVTNFEVKCQNLAKIDMEISRRGVGSKLMEKLGFKNIKIGVPEFDKHFTIKGHPETYIKFIFLDAAIQQKIHRLRYFSYLRLHENLIEINVDGTLTRGMSLKRFLDLMVDIAEKVEGKEPSTGRATESDQKQDIYHPSSEIPEKTKLCPECGAENIANAQFCENCGQEL